MGMTVEERFAKRDIQNLLKRQGYPTYARIFDEFDLNLTRRPDVVGFMEPGKGRIVMNRLLDEEQVSVIIRHEILHQYLEHEKRLINKLAKDTGMNPDDLDDLSIEELKHKLYSNKNFNIAADYEISNRGYTEKDKENARAINLNGNILTGLVTEDDHPEWVDMSVEEMYDLVNEERKEDQEQDPGDQGRGGGGDGQEQKKDQEQDPGDQGRGGGGDGQEQKKQDDSQQQNKNDSDKQKSKGKKIKDSPIDYEGSDVEVDSGEDGEGNSSAGEDSQSNSSSSKNSKGNQQNNSSSEDNGKSNKGQSNNSQSEEDESGESDSEEDYEDNYDDSEDEYEGPLEIGNKGNEKKLAQEDAEREEQIQKELDELGEEGESEEERQSRLERIAGLLDNQAAADRVNDETEKQVYSDRAKAAKERREAEKEAQKYGAKKSIGDFVLDLNKFIKNEVRRVTQKTWSKSNPSYEGTGILRKGKRKIENKDIPVINVYFDQSGSWDESDIKIGMDAIETLNTYVEKKQIKINVFYFSNKIYKNADSARRDGGTGAGYELIKHIQDTKPDNVIVMTDDDFDSWSEITKAPNIKVKGAVWLLFRNGKVSKRLCKHLQGMKKTETFSF